MASDPNETRPSIDWESFYANYRKPGYVRGYEILNKLGGGAFGIVFKARKQSIGKDYAIKFLKVDDAAVRDAVLHELDTVRLFAQIDHPNLVTIEDMGHVDGIPYIVMGYAGEETLARRLAAGPMPRAAALAMFVQIARAVQALHARMLVHFDLKPANVYLKDDVARVGDYGLSKLVTASRRSLSFGRGTTYYMAPEVLQRKGDHRSDIYSLGVLLYECLVGEVPFRGETEWEVLKKHESQTPHYPASLAASDRAVLEACLAKDPEARVQSVQTLLEMLTGSAVPAAPETGAPPLRPLSGAPFAPAAPRRRGHGRWILLGLIAAAAISSLFSVNQRRTARRAAMDRAEAQGELARQAAMARATRVIETMVAPSVPLPSPPGVTVTAPSTRDLMVEALLSTLRHVDTEKIKGQDPFTEALLEAVKASLENDKVRRSWREAFGSLLDSGGAQGR